MIRSIRLIGSRFPVLQSEAEDGMTDSERGEKMRAERAPVTPDVIEETTREAGQTEHESLFINTIYVGKEGLRAQRERLRVTVEISHPALHLPVYRTWTGN